MTDDLIKNEYGESGDAPDFLEALDVCAKFLRKETSLSEILQTYGPRYAEYAKAYVSSWGIDFLETRISSFLSESKDDTLRSLDEEGFSGMLAAASLEVASLVKKVVTKEIALSEAIPMIGETGVREIADTLIGAYDIDIPGIKNAAENIANAGSLIVAYAAFSEAYKILMSSLNDAAVQHRHRLRIEAECAKSVALIKEYREGMQSSISQYFEKHHTAFSRCFAMMDKAIEDNDSDGYIAGSAALQETLGYYVRFRNQEEFDDLMSSDLSFEL